MSVTENSSKHSTQASSASARATGGIGSSSLTLPSLRACAMLLDAVVHVGHEVVEMHAALAPHRHQLEEHVHQHGLAAADAAMDVEALAPARASRRLGEQPAERARLAELAACAEISSISRSSACADALLRRIALDLAASRPDGRSAA